MNFRELAENQGLDEDEFMELVEIFVEASASDLGRLESAIEEGDAFRVVEAAHVVKGVAGNLGFMEIYEVAKDVEENARKNSLEGAIQAVKTIKEKYNQIAEGLRKQDLLS